jgi:hypothetical protein
MSTLARLMRYRIAFMAMALFVGEDHGRVHVNATVHHPVCAASHSDDSFDDCKQHEHSPLAQYDAHGIHAVSTALGVAILPEGARRAKRSAAVRRRNPLWIGPSWLWC